MLNKENSINLERKRSKSGKLRYIYHFKCISCDNIIKAQTCQLKTHSGKCRRCSQLGEPYMFIYNELKAHNNRTDFNLTYREFLSLIDTRSCHYCDSKIHFEEYSRYYGKYNSRAYQLDRKDNLKGYCYDNLVVCCWDCNRLKSDKFTYYEFILLSPILKQIMKERLICKKI